MARFDYHATDPEGQPASGRIEAASRESALRQLTDLGLTVRDLTLVAEPSASVASQPLSASESDQLTSHLAQFGATGLPVEAGLRAAAAEVDNPRIAQALAHLANQLGQGTSLEAAIAQPGCQLPAHVSGLVATAARTGRLGTALAELLEHQYEARSLRRDVVRGFGYPLVVVGVACVVIFVIMFGISGVFQQMFDDFQLDLPVVTELLFWWRDIGVWVLLAGAMAGLGIALVIRQAIGPVAWLRLLSTMPIVGRLSFWTGMAEWTGLMSVLVRNDVPLPEALRLSAGGVRNAYVGNIVDTLATATERGRSFSDAVSENSQVPASLVPVFRWGERTGTLPEALSTTCELLSRRVRVRAVLIRAVLPPVLFVMIICQVGAMVMALFMPLFSLIRGLS